jgi:4-hydroxy-tetrahydrodipicolinate synthase
MTHELRGVYVPLITPFAADGSVALDAVESLTNEYLDAGAAGIVALGTTGETAALTAAERLAVIATCSRVCAARSAALIVGVGTNNTASTVAAVESLAGVPAVVGALVVVPYYVRPSIEGIVAHFRAVADASPVPVILYNIPYRTGRGLDAEAILALADHVNISGIKQAVGSLDRDTLEILRRAPRDFAVLGGEDPYAYPTVLLGGVGAIAASAHVLTERFVAMIECGLNGKVEDGRAHHEALLPVIDAGFAEPNPAVWKGILHAQGRIPTPDLRLPMTPASGAAVEKALKAIAAAS